MLRHLFAAASIASLALPAFAADVCNGHAELCGQLYSNVTFLGTHNSFGVGDSIAANQNKDVTAQLNDGIRTMTIQAHNASDGVHLCHSSCSLLDGGTMEDYLSSVNTWVQSNPNEVITLIIVNSDNLPPSTYDAIFQSSGLASHTYSPSAASLSISDWPTLGSLIDSGKTVMVYMDYNADFSSVPYIMDEFSNVWQDAYDVTTTEWGCAVNRSDGSAGSMMFMINHFLNTGYSIGGTSFYTPNTAAINTTNSQDSIASHVGNCNQLWGRKPNHILLDYYDSNGNAPFDYVAQLNSVPAPTNTVTAEAVSTNTATGSVRASGTGGNAQISQSSLSGGAGRVGGSWVTCGAVGLLGVLVGGMSILA